jgi:hypothetical protein
MNPLLIIGLLFIATLPLRAQGQEPNAAELKGLAKNVVKIISGDKAKPQAYFQINRLSRPMVEALREKNDKKAEELLSMLDMLDEFCPH